jgi:hypothetical protein
MQSLNDFIELMDHEFEDVKIKLTKEGIKLDGNTNSLKNHCKLNAYKSVDYIYFKDNTYPLIEFSDIGRQQNKILEEIDKIKKSDLDTNLRSKIIREFHKKVHKELVEKYKDTLSIISRIDTHVSEIPTNLKKQSYIYNIVVPPLHNEICDKKLEVARFLDDLESKITLAIPDEIYEKVQIILIDIFENQH